MSLGDSFKDSSVPMRRVMNALDLTTSVYCGVSTGTAGAYVIAPTIPIVRLVAGERFRFIANNSNTAAPTLSITGSGISAKTILTSSGGALPANAIVSSELTEVEYEPVDDKFRLVSRAVTGASGGFGSLSVPSGSTADDVVLYAHQQRIGNWVSVLIAFTTTITGTPAYITVSLPYTAANLGYNQQGFCTAQDGTSVLGICSIQNNSASFRVYRSDLANFSAGAGRGAYCNFSYLAA